jgi:DnaJ-class molecular chaperone
LALDPTLGHISNEEIKRAFRKMAMQHHPDKHIGATDKRKAREKFLQIRTAYETLRDPGRRKNYDLGLPHGESSSF